MIVEKKAFSMSGFPILFGLFGLLAVVALLAFVLQAPSIVFSCIAAFKFVSISSAFGFYMVQPNQGKVLTLFGEYIGTDKQSGLRWTIPFYGKKTISLRYRNFESGKIKVNDNLGNPIEIATIVVWSVTDTSQAVFEVDDYVSYVTIQSESALRNLASTYAYDAQDTEDLSLLGHPKEISEKLREEIQERLEKAGVTVHEARISHLAYAQEIASAMLQRQQATAIIAARSKIVEGAVGMVEMALDRLQEQNVVELDEERKALMVSNLLVVLCGDKATQPIVNTGSLY